MNFNTDEKNRIAPSNLLMVCLAMYTIWQMGVVYFSGTTLSLYGRVPISVDYKIYLGLMITGYLAAIIVNILFIKKTILIGKIFICAALLCNLLTLIPAPSAFTLSMYYVSTFVCVFMIGVNYNVETYLLQNKSELKFVLISTGIVSLLIGVIQGDFFKMSFLAFEIVSVVLLTLILLAYFKLPKEIIADIVSAKVSWKRNDMPKQLKLGMYGAAFISTMILVFSLAVAETVKHGVGLFYLSGLISTLYFALLIYKVKLSPYKVYTFSFGMAAIGFVFSAISTQYPKLIYAAIVLFGMASITGNMVGFLTNTVSTFSPTRFTGQVVVGIGFIVALLQTLLLELLRDNVGVLYTSLSVLSLISLVLYLTFESSLSCMWRKLESQPRTDVPLDKEAVIADTEQKQIDEQPTELSADTEEKPHTPSVFDVLTPREREITGYILSGYGNAEIAELLFLAENTVKSYRKEMYFKLQIHSRRELFALAERDPLI